MTEMGIPGLRLDYDSCPLGPVKKASVLVGLRKVPDNYGSTPGLAGFFKDVCDNSGSTATARLRFDLIDTLQAGIPGMRLGCFAYSADMTIMGSDKGCFESAAIITFLDRNNHFPILPVKDAEWNYFA